MDWDPQPVVFHQENTYLELARHVKLEMANHPKSHGTRRDTWRIYEFHKQNPYLILARKPLLELPLVRVGSSI